VEQSREEKKKQWLKRPGGEKKISFTKVEEGTGRRVDETECSLRLVKNYERAERLPGRIG